MKKHPDFCPVCHHRVFNMSDGSCMLCVSFAFDGTCAGCDTKITSIADHTCKQSGYLVCDHDCPSPIKEEMVVNVSFGVKVILHEGGTEWVDKHFDTIEEAAKEWAFGERDPSLDQDACHIARDPKTDKWMLLYI